MALPRPTGRAVWRSILTRLGRMAARGIFDTERFVTGEAVEVELPAASLPLRMVSGLIDLLVVGAGVEIGAGATALAGCHTFPEPIAPDSVRGSAPRVHQPAV